MPRRPEEGPKTIQEIHLEVELQEQREQSEVQQLAVKGGGGKIRGCGGDRSGQSQEDGWNLGSKKRALKLTNVKFKDFCLKKDKHFFLCRKSPNSDFNF